MKKDKENLKNINLTVNEKDRIGLIGSDNDINRIVSCDHVDGW